MEVVEAAGGAGATLPGKHMKFKEIPFPAFPPDELRSGVHLSSVIKYMLKKIDPETHRPTPRWSASDNRMAMQASRPMENRACR